MRTLGAPSKVTMGGSAAWRHRFAPHTATLIRKLLAAGIINLGKTHTVQFAYDDSTHGRLRRCGSGSRGALGDWH
jgi:Asp-tRNA(Asn)/Glu-tRNA(Gln) amidotransferase A subunit family amidase